MGIRRRIWIGVFAVAVIGTPALKADDAQPLAPAAPARPWALTLGMVDQLGHELGIERAIGQRHSWRFAYQRLATAERLNPTANWDGGTLGFRSYGWSSGPMQGLYLESKALAAHVSEPYESRALWNANSQGPGQVDYTVLGGGFQLGWQWIVLTRWALGFAEDLTWIYSDNDEFRDPNGRIRLNYRLWLGFAF